MTAAEAISRRRSVRAFSSRKVDPDLLRSILRLAARAPSGGNLQPWRLYIIGGEKLTELRMLMAQRIAADPTGEGLEYDIYPPEPIPPYSDRAFQTGEELYGLLGIMRDDKARRRAQFAQNFRFFDAPVGLFCFVHRGLGAAQWSDLGMYLQSLMLLLVEHGLASCPQECWAMYWKTVTRFLGASDELMLFSGMAIGYEDEDAPINRLRTSRAELNDFADFQGI